MQRSLFWPGLFTVVSLAILLALGAWQWRRMDETSRLRLERLAQARRSEPLVLEEVLRAFIEPALALSLDRDGGAAFVRVLARAYAERNERLRKFLSDHYGHVLREFSHALARCFPALDKEALYWRLDFLAGALRNPENLRRWYLSIIHELAREGGGVSVCSIEGLGWGEMDFLADVATNEALVQGWLAR